MARSYCIHLWEQQMEYVSVTIRTLQSDSRGQNKHTVDYCTGLLANKPPAFSLDFGQWCFISAQPTRPVLMIHCEQIDQTNGEM